MPSALETARALYGAWRLARFDGTGTSWFEATPEGFWRSFFAFVIVAPGYAVLRAIEHSKVPIPASGLVLVLVDGIAYVTVCVAYPLAMAYISQLIDRWERYILFIVALNWSVVLQMAVLLPTSVLAAGGGPAAGIGQTLVLLAFVAVLVYQWFITRTTLDISGMLAAAAVALDLFLFEIIDSVADTILRTSAANAVTDLPQ
jgi:hypothetical protein